MFCKEIYRITLAADLFNNLLHSLHMGNLLCIQLLSQESSTSLLFCYHIFLKSSLNCYRFILMCLIPLPLLINGVYHDHWSLPRTESIHCELLRIACLLILIFVSALPQMGDSPKIKRESSKFGDAFSVMIMEG
jgi:hypothetical protein